MTDYAPTMRTSRKRPGRRCLQPLCVHLTRHRTQRCPEHRTGAGTASSVPRSAA